MGLKIKTGDTVMIISGSEKGHVGKVLQVLPRKNKLIVEKANIAKKHTKAKSQQEPGGILDREMPIHRSNVMLFDAKSGSVTRYRNALDDSGNKSRMSVTSETEI